jgi:predicted MFS family arabinose efflux permease
LLGPLVGGMFARFGNWRSAFVATATVAGILAVSAYVILPPRSLSDLTHYRNIG